MVLFAKPSPTCLLLNEHKGKHGLLLLWVEVTGRSLETRFNVYSGCSCCAYALVIFIPVTLKSYVYFVVVTSHLVTCHTCGLLVTNLVHD